MAEAKDSSLCSAWNFGPLSYDECPVSDLMNLFCKEWGAGSNWIHAPSENAPHESSVLRLAIDKAIHQLPWRPRWNLHKAVKMTIAWYRKYYEDGAMSMQDACFADIKAYMNKG